MVAIGRRGQCLIMGGLWMPLPNWERGICRAESTASGAGDRLRAGPGMGLAPSARLSLEVQGPTVGMNVRMGQEGLPGASSQQALHQGGRLRPWSRGQWCPASTPGHFHFHLRSSSEDVSLVFLCCLSATLYKVCALHQILNIFHCHLIFSL